jgi:hypothetical protein
MPGRGRGFEARAAEQEGEADAEEAERGLGVLGELELLLVGRRQQVAEVDLGAAAFAEVRDLGVFEEVGSHAGRL